MEVDIYNTVAVINHAFEQHLHNFAETSKSMDWLITSLGNLPDSPLKVADGHAWLELDKRRIDFYTCAILTSVGDDELEHFTTEEEITSAKELFNLIHQWACDGHSVALAEAVGEWI